MINIKILLIIFIIFIAADKLLTFWNMQILSQSNPNFLQAEQNPMARWFFTKFGLILGTILFGLVSLAITFILYYSLSSVFAPIKVLWFIFILYGFVIFNNSFYLIKNMGLI